MKEKVGILTFHRAYNCGSMMQAYALEQVIEKIGYDPEIIDFSNKGQIELYRMLFKNNSLKNIVKNIILLPHLNQIKNNNFKYEEFIKKFMKVSENKYYNISELDDSKYFAVVAGSDQIWNITIQDHDDAYFLPWVKNAKKIAYAPSFGARNPLDYAKDFKKYRQFLDDFNFLSVRENNGKNWIKEISDKEAKVVLDPTLLLSKDHYQGLIKNNVITPKKYIFYYSPHYSKEINELVKKISIKLNLPVIAFNSKAFYTKFMKSYGFQLPNIEDPLAYLELISKAEIVITTSFHGTIFSSIFRKKFWVVKNNGMYEKDDRVLTLINMLDLKDRIITTKYDEDFNYNKDKKYDTYELKLKKQQNESLKYLKEALEKSNHEKSK